MPDDSLRSGTIYILRNNHLKQTVVKIGRTVRTSEDRAREISRATGVPSTYEVLYEESVLDSDWAERLAHESLATFRVNPRREFFDLPLKHAVKTVFQVALTVNQAISNETARLAIILDEDVGSLDDPLPSILVALRPHVGGTTDTRLIAQKSSYSCNISLGSSWQVRCTPELISALQLVPGVADVVHCLRKDEQEVPF